MHSAAPADELARLAQRIGVQRIAELTYLDDLPLHVVAAIRAPLDPASISVCAGRGETAELARRAAIAEALERYCAEPRGRLPTITAARPAEPHVPIARLVPAVAASEHEPVEWIRGARITDGLPVWVPASAVLFPYAAARWFAPATHGLAAGESLDDATMRALLECIERDAYTRAIALVTCGHGVRLPPLDPAVLSGRMREAHEHLRARGLAVVLRNITGGTGVPAVLATIAEQDSETVWAHRGCAADFHPQRAADRALAEAIQSRLIDIQGAREDLPSHRESPDPWFHDVRSEQLGPPPPALAETTCFALVQCLVGDGCGEPVVVDLSLDDIAWRVVRVVVPELETWADDPERRGARLERWCREP